MGTESICADLVEDELEDGPEIYAVIATFDLIDFTTEWRRVPDRRLPLVTALFIANLARRDVGKLFLCRGKTAVLSSVDIKVIVK